MVIKNNELTFGGGENIKASTGIAEKIASVTSMADTFLAMETRTMKWVYAQTATDNPEQGDMSIAMLHRASADWGFIYLFISSGHIYVRIYGNSTWRSWTQVF